MSKTINAATFKKMIESGSNNLLNHRNEIDALNVFPVPDGDTGTNMSMTFSAGTQAILNSEEESVFLLSKVFSKGLLMGARGNSGVILSQIFRGFSQGIENLDEIDAFQLAQAFVKGSEVAFKAVMKPVEGTILTVIRDSSYLALKHVEENPEIEIADVLEFFIQEAHKSLDNTPELLPVLKEVGVVDSGGAGLVIILEGLLSGFYGKEIKLDAESELKTNNVQSQIESEEFGYCTEFIFRIRENEFLTFDEDKYKKDLQSLGNSIVVVKDEDLVKVHVHTLQPGNALNRAQKYGEFVKIKIENMQEQHDHIVHQETLAIKPKKYGLITVSSGKGLDQAFKDLRVDVVINGGQTMNPSTNDFLDAINKINAEHIFIFPNNSNIILAAKQAASEENSKQVIVIETTSITQGLSVCSMFNPEVDSDANIQEFNEVLSKVLSGSITKSIKDSNYNGFKIKANQYIGILEKDIITHDDDVYKVSCSLLEKLIQKESELLTIVTGSDAKVSVTKKIIKFIDKNFNVEIDEIKGEQPLYDYYFGVE